MKNYIVIMVSSVLLFNNFYHALGEDILDQQQTIGIKGEKIYGDIKLAQSFTPSQDEITRVKIKVGRITNFKINSFLDFFKNMLKFLIFGSKSELHVSIKKSLDGETLWETVLNANKIEKNGGWIELKLENISHEWKEEFYIVCYAHNANKNDCFVWFYSDGDVYKNGSSYMYNDSIWKKTNRDYCFISYGKEHSSDGVVKYRAILVGIENYQNMPPSTYSSLDAIDMQKILKNDGWKIIYTLLDNHATISSFEEILGEIDMKDDGDDILLFLFSGWGNSDNICFYDGNITSTTIDKKLDALGSKKILVIDCWYSGGLIEKLAQEGRIIMASCRPYEKSWRYDLLRNSVFIYYVGDGLKGNADNKRYGGNGDGSITAEEVFRYASYYTQIFEKPQHPQIYDGIEGEVIMAPLR